MKLQQRGVLERAVESRFFWNEQYSLQAFLAFNDRFEVLWPGHYLRLEHCKDMAMVLPHFGSQDKGRVVFG